MHRGGWGGRIAIVFALGLGVTGYVAAPASAAPPANDDFANGELIASLGTFNGSNEEATTEAGELEHAGQPGGHSIWYTAPAKVSARFRISTCGSSIDTLLAVYTGSTVGSLTQVASNDDSVKCGDGGSAVVVDAQKDTVYHIVIDGKGGAEGPTVLNLEGPPVNDFFAFPAPLSSGFSSFESGTNEGASRESGEPEHAGQPGGASVWYSWTPESNGEVEISTCSNSELDTLLALYTGTSFASLASVAANDDSGNGCEPGDSAVAISVTGGTEYRIAVDGKNGSEGDFSLLLNGQPDSSEGGEITGTVTAFSGGAPLEGISACAYEASTGGFVECGYTDSSGKYTIVGLESGKYKVGFFTFEGDYLGQYYNGKASLNEAEPVSVDEGLATTGIDAALRSAGQITGTVTAFSGGAPLEGISACAYKASNNEYVECGYTDAAGKYTIKGLASGKYKVGFFTFEGDYLGQYYNGKASLNEAEPVSVDEGLATTGIDAALRSAGQITGTVTAVGGAPLGSVEVCAYEAGDGEFVDCAYTDSKGEYAIGGLLAGEYKVKFSAFEGNYLDQYFDEKTSLAEANIVSVAEGLPTPNIDAVLSEGGEIAGAVTAASGGAPLQNVSVCAYQSNSFESLGCGYTNSSGEYAIGGLASGQYKVRFSPSFGSNYLSQYFDGKGSFEEAEPVAVLLGKVTEGIDAALATGAVVKGTVTAASGGAPLEGISVCAYKSSGFESAGCTSTNPSGQYTLGGLAGGKYKLRFADYEGDYVSEYYDDQPLFEDANSLEIAAGGTEEHVDAALATAGSIEGVVTASSGGAALSGVSVCAYNASGVSTECGYTNSSGKYSIRGLASGEYKVAFIPSFLGEYLTQYYDDSASLAEADPISVTGGLATGGIDAALRKGGKVSGTVTAVGGAPIQGIQVCAYEAGESEFGRCASTNASGDYTIVGLLSGEYSVRFTSGTAFNYARQYYNGSASLDGAELISVVEEETTPDIDAVMTQGGQITGVVTAVGGGPIEEIEVCAYEFGGKEEFEACANTDAKGEYTLSGLPAGSHRVGFYPGYVCESGGGPVGPGGCSVQNYVSQYYKGKASFEDAEPVSVAAGGVAEDIDAQMQVGGQISGTVTDASSGDPISGIDVCYFELGDEEELGGCVFTNAAGKYTINGLATGSYQVAFSSSFGVAYIGQYYDGKLSFQDADPVPVTVGVETDEIDAALERALPALTVKKEGSGLGTVKSVPSGIDCGPSCLSESADFENGETITLTAQAEPGSEFVGWAGGGCSGLGTCVIASLDENTTVKAKFASTAPPPAPTITSLTPSHGPAAGGTSVAITGTNLSGATAIKFGSTNASAFSVTDATHATATAPAGSAGTTVEVTVTTPGGTSATAGSANDYSYDAAPPPAPTITSLTPSHGPAAGGTSVAITGTNLSGATAIKFGSTNASAFSVTDATHATATAPAGSAGTTVEVTVTTPGGTSATAGSANDYSYDAIIAPTCATDPSLCPKLPASTPTPPASTPPPPSVPSKPLKCKKGFKKKTVKGQAKCVKAKKKKKH